MRKNRHQIVCVKCYVQEEGRHNIVANGRKTCCCCRLDTIQESGLESCSEGRKGEKDRQIEKRKSKNKQNVVDDSW